MKMISVSILFILMGSGVLAQDVNLDSLKIKAAFTKTDTARMNIYQEISGYYNYKYPDSVLYYGNAGLALARKLNVKKAEITFLNQTGEAWNTKGNYPKSLEIKLKALQEAENLGDAYLISHCQNFLGALYVNSGDFQKALLHYRKAQQNQDYLRDFKKYILGSMGQCYFRLNMLDSAYYYADKSYQLDLHDKNHWTTPYYLIARIADASGDYTKALNFYSLGNSFSKPGALDVLNGYKGIAFTFKKLNNNDSAIYYAKKVVDQVNKRPLYTVIMESSALLTEIYKADQKIDSAFKYQQIMLEAKDSLFNQYSVKRVQDLTFNEQQRLNQLENARIKAREEYKTKLKFYTLIAGLVIISLFALVLYYNNRLKQRNNALLGKKNIEIQHQKNKLEDAIAELKSTQAQLIQSEKMASLGELTAGIAHEIQNPLNFVNNFSEVNTELIEELKGERHKVAGERNPQLEDELIGDLEQNMEKIAHHGKRADAIVKGMLQHSRKGSDEKTSADINVLADEYLRLSYHGLRAKNKDFNVTMKTDFDKSIGRINIIPQDIGRVLLNVYNNAFYAVGERRKAEGAWFEPCVSVSTKKEGDKVVVSVKDNGPGIPQNIIDKIFQPFFTNKPTGQGTGLGLSLSYDIIKVHGGEIKVQTKEGEGSTFIIQIPIG